MLLTVKRIIKLGLGIFVVLNIFYYSLVMADYAQEISYDQYHNNYLNVARPAREIIIKAGDFRQASADLTRLAGFAGVEHEVIKTGEAGYVEWEINVEEAGLYHLQLKYYPITGRGADIERSIEINGKIPFSEAKYISFTRIWENKTGIERDEFGNELRPPQSESPFWKTEYFKDSLGYYDSPYQFYFQQGTNTIRLISRNEPLVIAQLKLCQKAEVKSYQYHATEYQAKKRPVAKDVVVKIQGEDAIYKASSTLYPLFDQGDPTLEPYHPAAARINAIGGINWAKTGQWITWEFEVPQSGLYKIAIKGKQDQQRGFYSNRRLLINGEVPFQELQTVTFPFSQRYQMKVLGQNETGKPYLFYLEQGKHQITLEVVLGNLANIVYQTRKNLYQLNTIYRKIIMVTSSSPDPLRSYQLETKIPDLIENLREQAGAFQEIKDYFEEYTGQKGGHTAVLNQLIVMLNKMADQPYMIPGLLGKYRDNIGALGTWIIDTEKQPLTIDYMIVASPEKELPAARPTILQTLVHEVRAFINSFFHEYTSIGGIDSPVADNKVQEPLKVWIGSGRDQAQLLKQMIEDSFVPETGIPVKLELISEMGNLLIPASIAGTAPDVAIGAANMELAFRGALVDLAQFPDFEQVATRFNKSAFVPFKFRNQVFGLPEEQVFSMLFYRRDILAELGLTVPQTWEDVMELIPVLQKNNMDFGLQPNMDTYQLFLYQQGVPLFKEDCIATNFDSEVAAKTLERLTNFYSLYNLPLTFNIENRFRMGEMPLVVTGYNLYNTLKVFAPELRGEWGFAPIPGTRQADGTINRTIPAGTSAALIMATSQQKERAWEFLKWWTRRDTQVRFGLELENLMGAAARYATANVEALKELPWQAEERAVLLEQWKWVEGIPPVLGGYYVNRQFDWLFRAVVLDQKPLRESIQEYNLAANKEIARKRAEFGYETDYEKLEQDWKEIYWSNFTQLDKLELEAYKTKSYQLWGE